jgi:hypothetical protein
MKLGLAIGYSGAHMDLPVGLAWEDSGADSLNVRSRQPEAIEVMAKAARLN